MNKSLLATCITAVALSAAGKASAAGNLLFWGEYSNGSVGRVDTDGTNATNILLDVAGNGVGGVAVDPVGLKVYWVNYAGGGSGSNIQRANINGSSVETAVALVDDTGKWDVAIDSVNAKVYWTTWPSSGVFVRSSNFDGSGSLTVTGSTVYGAGVAVDPGAGKVYWSSFSNNTIRQANLNGSGAIDFVGATQPGYMDIDLVNQYIYYGVGGGSVANEIYRKSLINATPAQLIATDLVTSDIEVDPSGTLYYTQPTGAKGIYKIDLTGAFPATPSLVYDLSSQALPSGLGLLIVPEPAGAALLGLGCVVLARRRKSAQ